MTEPTYPCPKCGQSFVMSQLHAHYQTCQGRPQVQQQQIPQFPQQQVYQSPPWHSGQLYIPPPTPEHRHQWFENDTYKVCLDQSCKQIKVKLRGSWQIFVRYGLKLFFIELIIAFAVAFSLASAIGIRR